MNLQHKWFHRLLDGIIWLVCLIGASLLVWFFINIWREIMKDVLNG